MQKNLKTVYYTFVLNLLIVNANAQSIKGFSIEPSIQIGHIFKHTPKLLFPIPPLSIGTEIHLNWQTDGHKIWQQWHGYPSVGIGFLYYNLGDKPLFGNTFAVYPSIDLKVLKKIKLFETYIQCGWGLAYLTRHYDQFTNPLNNAIGSALNNVTVFKLRFEKPFSTHLKAQIGFSFTHFSNGSTRLPNLGINVPALNMGMKWTPKPFDFGFAPSTRGHFGGAKQPKSDIQNPKYTEGGYIHRDSSSKPDKKWGINVFSGLSMNASTVPRGPKYPIYTAAFSIIRPLSKVNLLSLGIQYEQNRVVAEFGLATGEYTSKEQAFKAGSRWGIFASDEFLFGHIAIVLQSGVYLHRYDAIQSILFNRIGLRWYSPSFGRSKMQGHIGIFLKAHKINAEQFCLLGGVSF